MKTKKLAFVVFALGAVLMYGLFGYGSNAGAYSSSLNNVNATCGTSYGCGLCHVDPSGGGTLTKAGSAFKASGDACYFCSTVCNPPAQPEICNDGIDNDGDGLIDCADPDCAHDPACVQVCVPTGVEGKGRTCSDGIDNDCDGLIDCADPKCARNHSCKNR